MRRKRRGKTEIDQERRGRGQREEDIGYVLAVKVSGDGSMKEKYKYIKVHMEFITLRATAHTVLCHRCTSYSTEKIRRIFSQLIIRRCKKVEFP